MELDEHTDPQILAELQGKQVYNSELSLDNVIEAPGPEDYFDPPHTDPEPQWHPDMDML